MKTKIIDIIENIIGKELSEQDGLLDQGILDSLLTIQLITDLEGQFEINIPVEEFSHHNFNSVQAITDLVIKLTAL